MALKSSGEKLLTPRNQGGSGEGPPLQFTAPSSPPVGPAGLRTPQPAPLHSKPNG